MADKATGGGYTAMLEAAAEGGTDDAGREIGSLLKRFKGLEGKEDPQQAMRNACAAQLLAAAAESLDAGAEKAVLLDVGSATGKDAGAWRAKAEASALGAERLDIVGVELVEKLNVAARESNPSCRFLEGNLTKGLPLDESSVDGAHCSRVLIHCQDMAKAIAEFVKVMKPGGVGIFEEGDFGTSTIMTGDERCAKVFKINLDSMLKKLANPYAARVAYTTLLAREDVENVAMESHSMSYLGGGAWDPDLTYAKMGLDVLVENGDVTREDVDYYLKCLKDAPSVGEPWQASHMFKITFTKKKKTAS